MEGVEVEGMDSFHPLMPMNRAIERSGGGMDEVFRSFRTVEDRERVQGGRTPSKDG
jgi:hypothetical protein